MTTTATAPTKFYPPLLRPPYRYFDHYSPPIVPLLRQPYLDFKAALKSLPNSEHFKKPESANPVGVVKKSATNALRCVEKWMAPQKEISYNLPAFPSHFPPYLDKYDVETCRTLMKREFRKIVAARMRSNKSVRLNAVPQVAIKRVAGGEFGPCNGQTCIGIDYVLMETQFSPVLSYYFSFCGFISPAYVRFRVLMLALQNILGTKPNIGADFVRGSENAKVNAALSKQHMLHAFSSQSSQVHPGKVTQAIGSIIQGKALSNHGQLRAPLPSEIDLSSLRSEQNRGPRIDKMKRQLVVKTYTTRAGNVDVRGNVVVQAEEFCGVAEMTGPVDFYKDMEIFGSKISGVVASVTYSQLNF
ncbi:hypothetical protein FXO38_23950 [Capsicum annuum]|nr:hypothetical protein FXO38_23950 [Capsicum annuum]